MNGNKVATACLVIIVIFLFGFLLKVAKPVLFPFFLAVLFSFVLSPAQGFLMRIKIPKAVSIIFILLVTFLAVYLLGTVFYSSGKAFASGLPKYGQRLESIFQSLQKGFKFSDFDWQTFDWIRQINLGKAGGFLLSSLGPFFSFIANLFLIFIFLVFIMAGRGKIRPKVESAFNGVRSLRIIAVIENIDAQVQRYLAIKTVVSLFTGIFAAVVMLLWGLDFAIVFGFLTFILNFIPNIGSFIATAFPVVIAVFQFPTLWPAIWICLILILIQQIMGNFVEPRLMGHGLGLSPLLVLFSLFFWGWLWGIPGMVLAVPITAVIKIVCSNIPELGPIAALMSKNEVGCS
ncbi:MAG: AI-2E family transporter [Candidatus Aminicenantes bacterium]|nr:AI-2E family transporter [Candidatus Aminicenantes bacterium]